RYSLISTTFPSMAAAAAVNGLAKNVLDLGPCLPSKFRLEVETQYFPAGILSSFIPRQAEHPAPLKLNPASLKMIDKPSLSACLATCADPGTTQASTLSAIFFPLMNSATWRKSSIRALVQLPKNT